MSSIRAELRGRGRTIFSSFNIVKANQKNSSAIQLESPFLLHLWIISLMHFFFLINIKTNPPKPNVKTRGVRVRY